MVSLRQNRGLATISSNFLVTSRDVETKTADKFPLSETDDVSSLGMSWKMASAKQMVLDGLWSYSFATIWLLPHV